MSDQPAKFVSSPGVVTVIGAGPSKRLYVNRVAAYRKQPSVMLELQSGEKFQATRARWTGPSEFVHDISAEEGPALWVETTAEVTLT